MAHRVSSLFSLYIKPFSENHKTEHEDEHIKERSVFHDVDWLVTQPLRAISVKQTRL